MIFIVPAHFDFKALTHFDFLVLIHFFWSLRWFLRQSLQPLKITVNFFYLRSIFNPSFSISLISTFTIGLDHSPYILRSIFNPSFFLKQNSLLLFHSGSQETVELKTQLRLKTKICLKRFTHLTLQNVSTKLIILWRLCRIPQSKSKI